MSEWKAKKFWDNATVEAQEGGFGVLLDGRPVKTPAKRLLIAPTKAFADAIAAEWAAQEDQVDPRSMPFTRSANAALDKVSVQSTEVAELLVAYGDSDLLCYRAEQPEPLVRRQAEQWDPILDWAAEALGARLETRSGVMHVPQRHEALRTLSQMVHQMSDFELAGFHDLVSLSGSLILGFAATRDLLPTQAIWDISRLDEIWQAQQWGKDEEAEADAAQKAQGFSHAKQVYELSNG